MDRKAQISFNAHFYLFLLFVVAVPLAITMYFENPVDLVKSAALRIVGGSFIIVTLLTAIGIYYFKKDSESPIEFDLFFDTPVLLFLITAVLSTIFSINSLVSFFGQYQRQIGLLTFFYMVTIY